MSSTPAKLSLPLRRIGRYVLGRRIGAGGMATVFAARQIGPLGFGRMVALKVMSSALLGDEQEEHMFMREAGISSRIQHDNVVTVYEVDEADATYFIAMELLVGATLRDTRNVGAAPAAIILTVLGDVANALHHAHELRDASGEELKIVHQDVSPHNIMITYDGVTKLLDFGVARIGQLDASRTMTVRGKPAYLSPEQLLGDRIDRRTDIFALGIVMHELCTGVRLFSATEEISIHDAVLNAPIPRPTDVPSPLADVCMKALSRYAKFRYQTAKEFAVALTDAGRKAGIEPASRVEMQEWITHASPQKWSLETLEQETLEADGGPKNHPAENRARAGSGARLRAIEATSETNTPSVSDASAEPARPRMLWLAGTLAVGAIVGAILLKAPSAETTSPASADAAAVREPTTAPTPTNAVPRSSATTTTSASATTSSATASAAVPAPPPPRTRPHAASRPPSAKPPRPPTEWKPPEDRD